MIYTRQLSFAEKSGNIKEDPKSTAAAVAAKLTASTSSAKMLTYVLSSLASEGVIGNPVKESSTDYPSEKRAKIENDHPYVPHQNPQSTLSSFSHPEQMQNNPSITSQELNPSDPPPPPSSPPPLPPLPPPMQPYQVPQYMQTAMPIPSGPYGYMNQQPPAPIHSYAPVGLPPINGVSTFPPSNAYQSYPTEGGFYGQPSSLPMAPMGRQQN